MTPSIKDYIQRNKLLIQQEMNKKLEELHIPRKLKDSMKYSVLAGGKRLRPVLMIASFEAYSNEKLESVLSTAVALELIHTYSLIHDDLPAMDDDDYRRGKLTNHKMFDEATAILAGDALLTHSFDLIANDPTLDAPLKVELIGFLARASGPNGMVAGQFLDMVAEKREVTIDELEQIHALKTGELVRYAVCAGAMIAGATAEQIDALRVFSHYLGLIFQVQDDILDVTGDEEKLGKPVGSDLENEKSTYPKLLGIAGAIQQKQMYVEKAKEALVMANVETSHLMNLIDYFSVRDH